MSYEEEEEEEEGEMKLNERERTRLNLDQNLALPRFLRNGTLSNFDRTRMRRGEHGLLHVGETREK